MLSHKDGCYGWRGRCPAFWGPRPGIGMIDPCSALSQTRAPKVRGHTSPGHRPGFWGTTRFLRAVGPIYALQHVAIAVLCPHPPRFQHQGPCARPGFFGGACTQRPYTLGMAVTVQGSKHVLVGEKELSYGPGQSLLTTIDLPVSYHITRATVTEPYLGIMLKFDISLITQVASKIEGIQQRKIAGFEPIWVQRLDAPVLDALYRLLSLWDEPALISPLAPLIQPEIIVRLLSGPHAPHLWQMVNAMGNHTTDRQSRDMDQATLR